MADVLHEGWAEFRKRPEKAGEKRYFRFTEDALSYYNSDAEAEAARGKIALRDIASASLALTASSVASGADAGLQAVVLQVAGKTLALVAEDAEFFFDVVLALNPDVCKADPRDEALSGGSRSTKKSQSNSRARSAISRQPSKISRQPSKISRQPSKISRQPSGKNSTRTVRTVRSVKTLQPAEADASLRSARSARSTRAREPASPRSRAGGRSYRSVAPQDAQPASPRSPAKSQASQDWGELEDTDLSWYEREHKRGMMMLRERRRPEKGPYVPPSEEACERTNWHDRLYEEHERRLVEREKERERVVEREEEKIATVLLERFERVQAEPPDDETLNYWSQEVSARREQRVAEMRKRQKTLEKRRLAIAREKVRLQIEHNRRQTQAPEGELHGVDRLFAQAERSAQKLADLRAREEQRKEDKLQKGRAEMWERVRANCRNVDLAEHEIELYERLYNDGAIRQRELEQTRQREEFDLQQMFKAKDSELTAEEREAVMQRLTRPRARSQAPRKSTRGSDASDRSQSQPPRVLTKEEWTEFLARGYLKFENRTEMISNERQKERSQIDAVLQHRRELVQLKFDAIVRDEKKEQFVADVTTRMLNDATERQKRIKERAEAVKPRDAEYRVSAAKNMRPVSARLYSPPERTQKTVPKPKRRNSVPWKPLGSQTGLVYEVEPFTEQRVFSDAANKSVAGFARNVSEGWHDHSPALVIDFQQGLAKPPQAVNPYKAE